MRCDARRRRLLVFVCRRVEKKSAYRISFFRCHDDGDSSRRRRRRRRHAPVDEKKRKRKEKKRKHTFVQKNRGRFVAHITDINVVIFYDIVTIDTVITCIINCIVTILLFIRAEVAAAGRSPRRPLS